LRQRQGAVVARDARNANPYDKIKSPTKSRGTAPEYTSTA
jgi:hypothetical protein